MSSLDARLNRRPAGRHRAPRDPSAAAEIPLLMRAVRDLTAAGVGTVRGWVARAGVLAPLSGFLLYVVLSAWAGDAMSIPLGGGLNLGILLGLLQLAGFLGSAVRGELRDRASEPPR